MMFAAASHKICVPGNTRSERSVEGQGRSATEFDPNADEGRLHRQGLGLCFHARVPMAIGGSQPA